MNSLSLLNLYLFGRLRKQPRFCNTSTGFLVCYTAVFRVVTQCSPPWGGALRDDTKNGCVADYWFLCKMM